MIEPPTLRAFESALVMDAGVEQEEINVIRIVILNKTMGFTKSVSMLISMSIASRYPDTGLG